VDTKGVPGVTLVAGFLDGTSREWQGQGARIRIWLWPKAGGAAYGQAKNDGELVTRSARSGATPAPPHKKAAPKESASGGEVLDRLGSGNRLVAGSKVVETVGEPGSWSKSKASGVHADLPSLLGLEW